MSELKTKITLENFQELNGLLVEFSKKYNFSVEDMVESLSSILTAVLLQEKFSDEQMNQYLDQWKKVYENSWNQQKEEKK